jgi:DNA-directed RNA polymerase specialized sigma24 family protein
MSLSGERSTARHYFVTTQWSVVLTASGGTIEADAALERLCSVYWLPLYAFIRRRGYEAHDAQDLTQEFFFRLLAKDSLRAVDRSKGKFRSFLLGALEHFLANEWRNAHAQKRGGKFSFVSTDIQSAEQQYLQVPHAGLSPKQTFERQWATTVLDQTLARLRGEWVASGKGTQFESLRIFLTGEKRASSYAELAARFGTTTAALKMTVSRMRKRYGELLREEIASTVSTDEEVDEEMRSLFAALS